MIDRNNLDETIRAALDDSGADYADLTPEAALDIFCHYWGKPKLSAGGYIDGRTRRSLQITLRLLQNAEVSS